MNIPLNLIALLAPVTSILASDCGWSALALDSDGVPPQASAGTPATPLRESVSTPLIKDQGCVSNSTALATGVFNAVGSVCMYNVDVYYTERAYLVEIYAAPAGTTGFPSANHLIFAAVPNPTAGHWTWDDIPATYDGSDAYLFAVSVTFDSVTETHRGAFRDIHANSGNVIQMTEE